MCGEYRKAEGMMESEIEPKKPDLEATNKRLTLALRDAEAENQRLRDALKEAIELIRVWHGMRMPRSREESVWNAYQSSPEMKRINAAIAREALK